MDPANIRRAQTGDVDAFTALVAGRVEAMQRTAMAILGHEADALGGAVAILVAVALLVAPTDDWLSESDFQPLQPDGSSIGPPAAIYLSSGSYDRWALDPASAGPDNRGVEPREATYLLQFVSDGCNDVSVRAADCLPPAPRWRIVGRFDPIPPLP